MPMLATCSVCGRSPSPAVAPTTRAEAPPLSSASGSRCCSATGIAADDADRTRTWSLLTRRSRCGRSALTPPPTTPGTGSRSAATAIAGWTRTPTEPRGACAISGRSTPQDASSAGRKRAFPRFRRNSVRSSRCGRMSSAQAIRRPHRARTTETLPREECGVVESRARRRAPACTGRHPGGIPVASDPARRRVGLRALGAVA
jgi:hypothetical protein